MTGEASLSDTRLGGHNHLCISVLLLGFDAADEDRLKKIFQLTPGTRRYSAVPHPAGRAPDADILLVNYDNPAALAEKTAILNGKPDVPVVAVSRGPLSEHPAHHIRGMLMATRVLGVLDKVPVPEPPARSTPSDGTATHSVIAESRSARDVPPITTAPPPVIASEPPQSAPPPSSKGVGYHALVVDDSPAMQKSIELNLATLDQITAIDFAASGEEALEKAGATSYDLVFLDVMMPGLDGYETCTKLRKIPGYKKTPIIMVTGKTSPLDEVKGVMAGCTTYVTKPIQAEEFKKLAARIVVWLKEYKPR